jgi:hypothetical protein
MRVDEWKLIFRPLTLSLFSFPLSSALRKSSRGLSWQKFYFHSFFMASSFEGLLGDYCKK